MNELAKMDRAIDEVLVQLRGVESALLGGRLFVKESGPQRNGAGDERVVVGHQV